MLRLKTDADEVTQLAFDGAGLLVVASVPWPDRAAAFAGLVSATAVARYDLESGAEVGRRVCRGSGAVLSPDRSELWFLWSGTQSRRISDVRCRVLATDEETPVHLADEYCVTRLAVSPDGGSLAMGGYDWRVGGLEYVWRLRTRDGSVRPPIRADVSCLGYSPDAALLATGAQSGVTVWPEAGPYRHFAEPATELAWSPDGSLAWTADGDIHVAEPADPGPVRSFERPGELFTALGFSPDGRLLLAGTRGGLVHAFDRRDGLVRSLGWEIGPVHALAFAPDGLTAAAGGERGQVVVWDVDG